ncbi:MAG: endodeoxyribonuclease RusA [Gammaproteobacteria bacterium]|nr:endodeoxyribonuclease RusA [Gammaproteobacteria bacterium]
MLEFTVPWPPKELSPNARKHWGARSKKAKQYRAQCFAYAHNALQAMAVDVAGKLVLALVFRPPNRRKRDDDNLVAAFKSGRDGIADALGIDDSRFVTQFEIGEPAADGIVEVTIYKKDSE